VVRIIGIDPGLRRMGWGVIEQDGSRLSFVACGTVQPDDKLDLGPRLALLHQGLSDVFETWQPDESAVEETFVNKDARATLKLGQARGIAMLVPAQKSMIIGEYAPNQVKKTVVGAGHAEKQQIRMMVKILLPKAEFRTDDAADALAIAITHAQNRGLRTLEKLMR
jgi:crossover junction endodeoxyribonuclease RuvC